MTARMLLVAVIMLAVLMPGCCTPGSDQNDNGELNGMYTIEERDTAESEAEDTEAE